MAIFRKQILKKSPASTVSEPEILWSTEAFKLHFKKFLVAAAVLIVHQLVCLGVILEFLYDGVPYKGTAEFAGDDADVAHRAG